MVTLDGRAIERLGVRAEPLLNTKLYVFFRQILSRPDQIRPPDMNPFTADLIRTSLLMSSVPRVSVPTSTKFRGNTEELHPVVQ